MFKPEFAKAMQELAARPLKGLNIAPELRALLVSYNRGLGTATWCVAARRLCLGANCFAQGAPALPHRELRRSFYPS